MTGSAGTVADKAPEGPGPGLPESDAQRWARLMGGIDLGRTGRLSARDGTSLAWRAWGEDWIGARRTPVLALSGLTRSSLDFLPLAAEVCQERPMVALDYRGRGLSQHASDPLQYQPDTLLSDLSDAITALGLGRVAVVGTSLGGLVAMALAVARPTTVAALIINDIGPVLGDTGLSHIVDLSANPPVVETWAQATAFCRLAFPELPPTLTEADWERIALTTFQRREDGRLAVTYDPRCVRALVDTRDSDAGRDLWALYGATVALPQLVVRGEASRLLSAETLALMARRAPGAVQVTVPGYGHVPPLHQDPALAEVRRLLTHVDALP